MKKTLLFFSALALAQLSSAHASSVVFSAVPGGRTVLDADGTTVLTSGAVWVGTFSSESFSLNSNVSVADNVSAITLAGGWERFGLDTVSDLPDTGVSDTLSIRPSPAGRIGGAVTDNNFGSTKADFFNGKPLYLWIFNASTPASATEFGIFRATSATTPWLFPTNAGGVGDSTTYSTTSAAAPVITAIGGSGSTTSSSLRLVTAVPEPSTAAVGWLVAASLLAQRRRKTTGVLPGLALALAAVSLPVGNARAADELNAPVGYITQTIAGGGSPASPRLSVLAPTLVRPIQWQGTIASFSSNTSGPTTIFVAGNPWVDHQFDGSNGSFYVEIVSGANPGTVSDIVSTAQGVNPTGSSITLADNASALALAGQTIKIRRHVTLASFLGAGNEAGLLASDDPSTADEVLIYNGASAVSYFYFTGAEGFPADWYDAGFSLPPGVAAQVIIRPHQGVVIKRKAASPIAFGSAGTAKVRNTRLPIFPGINVVGTVSAAGLTLGKSGLYTGDAATGIAAADDPSLGDEVTIFTATGQQNYFYFSGDPEFPAGWYDSVFALLPGVAENIPIPVGSALVFHRKNGAGFNWSQPAPIAF